MNSINVVVVDFGSGNLRSVAKAIEHTGARPVVTNNSADIVNAEAVILPGVGSGQSAMEALHQRRIVESIKEYIDSGRPFLGICLGMQLLMSKTDEGDVSCLGIIPGTVKKLPAGLKVPHMGWNQVSFKRNNPLFHGVPESSHFYFVHSYYADPEDDSVVAGTTQYGTKFCSVLSSKNVTATQFHPEKSGSIGLKIYENFVGIANA